MGGYAPMVVVVVIVVAVTVVRYRNFGFWKIIGFLDFLLLEN